MNRRIAVISTIFITILVVINFLTNNVANNNFEENVPTLYHFSFFETNYLYFLILLSSITPPFILSFDKKVNFISKYKFIWPGVLLTAFLFLIWDIVKTHVHVWTFNETYLSGYFIGNLPIEEYLFFLAIPFACIFIYECLLNYRLLPYLKTDIFTPLSIAILLIVGIVFWTKLYTSTVCLISAAILILHWQFSSATIRQHVNATYLVAALPFIFVNGALTGAFHNAPVVMYNPQEILNIRLLSIPIEDGIYLYPLLLLNITFYVWFKNRKMNTTR